MNKNYLLIFMIFCYSIPIFLVCSNYKCNNSVSNIICDKNCKYIILFSMILMGIGTIYYEIVRADIYSIILISFILVGIYGLIIINEYNKIHYIFATIVFICIFLFMMRHCMLLKCNKILFGSLILQLLLILLIVKNIDKNIFYSEVFYILNFAFFYLYLHFL